MNASLFKLLSVVCALACCLGCGQWEDLSVAISPGEPARLAAASEQEDDVDPSEDKNVPPRAVPIYSRDIAPLLEKYCLSCHDSISAQGGVVMDVLRDEAPDLGKRSLMLRMADNLRSESMPPEGEPRPSARELESLNSWLDTALIAEGRGARRVAIRHLNRAEYNNTVCELIGLDLHPADEFPSDDVGYGFDNVGEMLSTPPILLEMYLAAADKVIDEACRFQYVRERLLNPPVDTVPLAFRHYRPAVRTPREDKIFKAPRAAPDPELARQQHIYDILRAFCDRAFRRPATHDELTRLLGIVLSAESDGEPAESAIQLALRTVLVSPQFLFLGMKPDHGSGFTSDRLPDNDFDLATRTEPRSHFARRCHGTGPTRHVPHATGAWTRSVSDSRTSMPSAAGDRTKEVNRLTPRASCPAVDRFRGRPSSRRPCCHATARLFGASPRSC